LKKKLTVLLLFIILGFYLPNVFSAAVTFNVYQDEGPEFTVSGINVDCNGTAYDRINKTSPFTINFDNNIYECKFSNINKDWKEKIVTVNASTTNTQRVEMEFKNYPVVYQFLQEEDAITSANYYQTVAAWTYEPNFGSDTTVQVGCTIEVSSNKHGPLGEWQIHSSDDGETWTTRGSIERNLTEGMIGSVYVSTKAWTVSDGTRYFKIVHRRKTNPASATVISRNAVCNMFTNKSDSNSTIKIASFDFGKKTVKYPYYWLLSTWALNSDMFNGFLFVTGSVNYAQITNDSDISLRLKYNDNPSKIEYPRFVKAGTNASGSFAEFVDVNANQNTNIVFEGKRSADISYMDVRGVSVFHLSQDENEYDQIPLDNITVSSGDGNIPIASMILSNTKRGIYVSTTAPVTSSGHGANSKVEMYMQIKGETYDKISRIISRTFPDADTFGTIKNQFVFKDVNNEDVNVILWAKATSGDVTIHGGNFIALTVN